MAMEEMLALPADRPQRHPIRLVLLMGMTALLMLTIYGGTPHDAPRPTMVASAASAG